MRVVVDTNVLVSGIVFGGVPGRILDAWIEKRFELIVSPDIVDEYTRVGERLVQRYPKADLRPVLALIARSAESISGVSIPVSVCEDPDDDKFLACALAAGADLIVSGDRGLCAVSGHEGIPILTPRRFVDQRL